MATRQRLEEALRNADAAGDVEAAKRIAQAIRNEEYEDKPKRLATERLQGMSTPEEREPIPSQIESYVSGATALPKGAFQLGANIGDYVTGQPEGQGFGDAVNATLRNQAQGRQQRREAVGREGFDGREMVGMVSSPTTFMQSGIAKGAGLGSNMLQGAKTAGVYGAAMPTTDEDFAGSKRDQIISSILAGGAVPLLGKGAGVVSNYTKEALKPLTKKGIESDVGKYVREVAGGDKDKVINALRNAQSGDTSGQAIARANRASRTAGRPDSFGGQFVATEQALSKKSAGGDTIKKVYEGQQADRENLIKAIAGTDDQMSAAVGKRAGDSTALYQQAYNTAAKADPELAQMAQNPYFKKAFKTASDLAKANGINPKDNLIEFLHFVKIGLDKQLGKVGDDALAATERKAVNDLKGSLVGWMGKKAPTYEQARSTFAKGSEPINQMNVGRELEKGLVAATEQERPSMFLNAVREAPRTIKRSTGFNRYDKLDDVLNEGQVGNVNKVKDALLNEAKRKNMATNSENMLKELSGEIEFRLPHLLSRPVVMTNALLSKISKDKTPEYRQVLAGILKDPSRMEKILASPGTPEYQVAIDILNEAAPKAAAIVAAGDK